VKILVDHDIEGHAVILWGALVAEGWLDLIDVELVMFSDAGLPTDSSDRVVWHFAQAKGMILLTNNRNMEGDDSLERTLREENRAGFLPVVTIGRVDRLDDKAYRDRCVSCLVDIVLGADNYRGTARLFIP